MYPEERARTSLLFQALTVHKGPSHFVLRHAPIGVCVCTFSGHYVSVCRQSSTTENRRLFPRTSSKSNSTGRGQQGDRQPRARYAQLTHTHTHTQMTHTHTHRTTLSLPGPFLYVWPTDHRMSSALVLSWLCVVDSQMHLACACVFHRHPHPVRFMCASACVSLSHLQIHLPYVADENHDEDPEVKFVTSVDDTPSGQLRQGFLNAGGRQVSGEC